MSEASNKFWFEPRFNAEQGVWYVSKCERDGEGKSCEDVVEDNILDEKDAVLKAWEHMKKSKQTEAETDCWLQGANGQYLMESPKHKIMKGEVTSSMAEIREALAEVFHDAWSHWSKAVKDDIKSPDRVSRWESSWVPYAQLDESTKDMDREWADEALEKIEKFIKDSKVAKEMVTRLVESSEEDWKSDLALTLLSEATADFVDNVQEMQGSPEAAEWLKGITGPQMEVTETVPGYGEEVGVDWSRFLPYKLVDAMEKAVNEKWQGKATLAELYLDYPLGASRLLLQLLGHGVSLTDDKEGEAWLEEKGLTKEDARHFPLFESAYEEAFEYVEALIQAYDEQHAEG
jgi:hypothetical protein